MAPDLGRPVKQAGASTFKKEFLVVGDAAFGEFLWVLDSARGEKTASCLYALNCYFQVVLNII